MTIGQVQIPRGPPLASTNANVVKIPVVIEMNENATAKDSKWRSERTNCCRYPYLPSLASSLWWVRVVTGHHILGVPRGEAVVRAGLTGVSRPRSGAGAAGRWPAGP